MGSAIFAKEIRPVVDTTLFFEAVREAAKRDPSEGPLAGGAVVFRARRTARVKDRRVDKTARANPKYRRRMREGQPFERRLEQIGQIATDLAMSILAQARLTRVDVRAPAECRPWEHRP